MFTRPLSFRFFLISICFASFCTVISNAQKFSTENLQLINGFSKAIQGENIPYFSLYKQYAKEALLTRCTDGKKVIEWETDVIPEDINGDYAYFTWIAAHSSGTSSGERHFDLYVNDDYLLTFTTKSKEYPPIWSFSGKEGTVIQFEFKIRDGANDSHGMAYLKVPLSKYKKGSPLKLKVVGQNQNSNDWYMTFKYAFKEKIEVEALPFLLKDKAHQELRVTVLHFGPSSILNLSIDSIAQKPFEVKHGFNVFDFPISAVTEPKTMDVKASVGKILSVDNQVKVTPVTYRELDLVHHSHTDIGYSHIQEQVINIHNDDIRQALASIEKTKNYPEGSRFIWNIESSWVVDNFLTVASNSEKENFLKAVRNGQIAISSNYANILTGLAMPEEIDWISDYAIKLRDEYNLPINTAMSTDVPGLSWSVVSSLAKRGVRYYSCGINYIPNMPGGGDRIGHALEKHGDKPFWWISPSKQDSILVWCAGKGYSSWHGTGQGAVFELGPDKISTYLKELDAKNYPYDIVQWRYNIMADNGPTDNSISDFVAQWNEKYASPKLVLANVQELFERFEKQYGHDIQSLSGDFTPYWEDGAYSTAREESENRMTSQKIILLEKVIQQKKLTNEDKLLALAKKYVVLFHEHTWGAYNSISEPDVEFVKHQWEYKKSYLDSAMMYTQKLEDKVLNQLQMDGNITVINTQPYSRSSYVEVKCPATFTDNVLKDENGEKILVQKLKNGNMGFIAENIPANGEKRYTLVNKNKNKKKKAKGNFPITFGYDEVPGNITDISEGDKQWVDASKFGGMMQTLYMDGLDPNHYTTPKLVKSEWLENGTIVKTWRGTYTLEGTNGLIYNVSQFDGLNTLKVSVTIEKKPIRDKESVHFVMPFNVDNAITRIGVGDGVISPNQHQLAGGNRDYYSVQRWINVGNDKNNVTISCPQGGLYEIGQMVNEERVINGYKKWLDHGQSSSTVFLYAMNNYWHTNYKADQGGNATFDVYLKFDKQPFDATQANQFGYECTEPLFVIGQLL